MSIYLLIDEPPRTNETRLSLTPQSARWLPRAWRAQVKCTPRDPQERVTWGPTPSASGPGRVTAAATQPAGHLSRTIPTLPLALASSSWLILLASQCRVHRPASQRRIQMATTAACRRLSSRAHTPQPSTAVRPYANDFCDSVAGWGESYSFFPPLGLGSGSAAVCMPQHLNYPAWCRTQATELLRWFVSQSE